MSAFEKMESYMNSLKQKQEAFSIQMKYFARKDAPDNIMTRMEELEKK